MLNLSIVTPEREVLAVECDEVTVPGVEGYLGFLPGHSPILVALATGRLAWKGREGTGQLVVSGGFCEVSEDHVRVLADLVEDPTQIDLEDAIRDKTEATAGLKTTSVDELPALQSRLALAEARIAVGNG